MDNSTIILIISLVIVFMIIWWSSQKHNQLKTTNQLIEQEKNQLLQQLAIQQSERHATEQLQEQQRQQLLSFSRELASAQQTILQQQQWQQELQLREQQLEAAQLENTQLQVQLTGITTKLQNLQQGSEEKQQFLINSEQRLLTQFENLASKIFEKSGQNIDQQNQQSLQNLLNPLREQIEGFKTQVQESFSTEAKERHTLTFEIRHLQQLNQKITEETNNLTQALKGDNKIQGNWGEVVLQRLLELAGLREGQEFRTQVSLQDSEGRRLQPDIIIDLPQRRQVILDAKMTLVAYERYYNSDNDKQRTQALQEHLNAVKQHIKQLSGKAYQQLPEVQSLDFVILFIPIESAFALALQQEPSILDEALRQNIVLASPSSLMAILRTIHHLWREEYQNQHAKKIATRATKLYDKFRLFIDDIENLGQSLGKAQDNYQAATNKLYQGRGNLIMQIEQFRGLGISVKKPLSEATLNRVMTGHETLSDAENADE